MARRTKRLILGGKRRTRRTRRRGGSGAASWMERTVGSEPTQYSNVFEHPSVTGNAIKGLQGQVAGGHRRHKRRGGFMGVGAALSRAVVPLTLLGLQQTYTRRRRHK